MATRENQEVLASFWRRSSSAARLLAAACTLDEFCCCCRCFSLHPPHTQSRPSLFDVICLDLFYARSALNTGISDIATFAKETAEGPDPSGRPRLDIMSLQVWSHLRIP